MNSNLLTEIENRNTELERTQDTLEKERKRCSKRASEIQFILIGLQGEIEANKKVIQKLKVQK